MNQELNWKNAFSCKEHAYKMASCKGGHCKTEPRIIHYLYLNWVMVSEKYRGSKSDGIIYLVLAKYRCIPSGGIDFQ